MSRNLETLLNALEGLAVKQKTEVHTPESPKASLAKELTLSKYSLLSSLHTTRQRSGKSTSDLASEMGVVESAIQKIETAGNSPDIDLIIRYALALNLYIKFDAFPFIDNLQTSEMHSIFFKEKSDDNRPHQFTKRASEWGKIEIHNFPQNESSTMNSTKASEAAQIKVSLSVRSVNE